MQKVPLITPQLKAAKGGLTAVLEAMRGSGDDDLHTFLAKYDETGERDRESLTWEEIATSAGVATKALMGGIMIAMREQQQNVSSIMAMTSHPEIMEKRIEFAKKEGGVRDRDAVDTHLGFLPTKNGAVINNRIQVANLNGAPGEKEREIEVGPELDMTDEVLPELNVLRQKMLEGKR